MTGVKVHAERTYSERSMAVVPHATWVNIVCYGYSQDGGVVSRYSLYTPVFTECGGIMHITSKCNCELLWDFEVVVLGI